MANVQLQKTVTKTAVDQKQSLEIVQTMLHGGLSTLAYLRNFFSDKAFEVQFYDSQKIHPYADYAAGNLSQDELEIDGPKTKMQILKRGGSRRADMLLDWLEGGVFKALRDSSLHSLEVYVHPDSKDRERVIEQYTFTVTYALGPENGQTLARLEIDSDGNPLLSLEATNDALTSLLKQIMKICEALPELPAKKFITMRLFYTQETQHPPKLQGWLPSTSNHVVFGQCDGWERRIQELDAVQSGFHSSSLKIDHLQPIGDEAKATFAGYAPPALPERLHFTRTLRNLDKPEELSQEEKIAAIIERLEPSPDYRDIAEEPHYERSSPNIPESDFTIQTQASNVPGMLTGLNAMLQPNHLTQGDTQAPSLTQHHAMNGPTKGTKPKLARSTMDRLEKNKDLTMEESSEEIISCQCRHAKDEGHMICCVYCNTWQHLHCYGYSGESDPRLPLNHVCYECLLGSGEDRTLQKLKDLTLKRRGMRAAVLYGLKGQREFSTDMRLSSVTGAAVYQHLKKEGYILGVKGSHKPGYAASGKPQFVAIKEGPNHQKMLTNLFNPMMFIGHHFEIPTNFDIPSEVLSRQLFAAQRKNMPPPITPASQMKSNVEHTPSTIDLDRSTSETQYETPIRPRSHLQTNKRARKDDDNVNLPQKRRTAARLPSNATAFMLDAGVLSPTPAFVQGSDVHMQPVDPTEQETQA